MPINVTELGVFNITDDPGNVTKQDFRYLYRNLANYFLVWYLAVVIVVGFFGAAFCLFFLVMSRLFPKIILVWLISICVGDLMILLLDALRMGVKVWFRFDVRDYGLFSCRFHIFLSNYFFYFSAYMQTFMSLQRLYFVYRPLQARTHLTLRRVVAVWGVVVTLVALPHLPYILRWHIGPKGDCEPVDTWYYYVTTLLDLSLWGIIPLVLMTISTLVISFKIFSFKETFGSGSADTGRKASHHHTAGGSSLQPSGQGRRHGGADNAAHVTKLLVAMNVFYMLTTYPLLIYLMHLNFGLENKVGITIPQPVHKFYYYLFRSLCYLNSSLNWVFYCAAGRLFRRRARLILLRLVLCRLCLRRNGDSSQGGFYGAGWDSSQIPLNQRRGEYSGSNDRLTVVSRLPSKTPIPDVLPRGKTFRFGPPAATLLRDQSASNV